MVDLKELEAFLTGFWLTDLANFSAYFYEALPDVNWVGFYLSDGEKLRLGPFCGKPACTEITFSKGVCGKAFLDRKSIIVDDVDEFPNHIRCDVTSKSEMVLPVFISDRVVGVLDMDSPIKSRFTSEDLKLMEAAIKLLTQKISGYPGGSGRIKLLLTS